MRAHLTRNCALTLQAQRVGATLLTAAALPSTQTLMAECVRVLALRAKLTDARGFAR
jgi:hypothetical protein